MRASDTRLDELLGRGTIGASRRDAILETVLVSVKRERDARRRWWALAASLAFGLAAATTALLLVPSGWHRDSSGLRSKGSASSSGQPLVLECVGAALDACPAGSLLVVRVNGLEGYVSAWAEPEKGGERIWYFAADTYSPLVDGTKLPGAVTSRAARVGAEHGAGAYIVEVRLTAKPMGRADLLREPASSALASARQRLTVIRK